MLREALASVRRRIGQACQRSGRDPSSVTLVAVTKGVAVERIHEAIALGVAVIGENRVQEAQGKHARLSAHQPPLRWHLVGHLQRNKAGQAVELFQVIHSVDSVALAEALERQAAARDRPLEVLIQVNVSGEATKFGCAPDEAAGLARGIRDLPHLRLTGLMTLAPFSEDPETSRPQFRRLRELRDHLTIQVPGAGRRLQLSMGMSQDFEVAIEEGADLVRIGTAVFGPRATG